MEKVLSGESDFAAQLAEYPAVAFHAAVAILRHREDAEDVAQAAIAKAYRSYAQLRKTERFPFWLARIARRLAINYRRDNQGWRWTEIFPCEAVETRTAMDALLEQERAQILRRSIARLPKRLRAVTVLVGLREHRVRDVAIMLQVTEGTVKRQLFVARKHLRHLMR